MVDLDDQEEPRVLKVVLSCLGSFSNEPSIRNEHIILWGHKSLGIGLSTRSHDRNKA